MIYSPLRTCGEASLPWTPGKGEVSFSPFAGGFLNVLRLKGRRIDSGCGGGALTLTPGHTSPPEPQKHADSRGSTGCDVPGTDPADSSDLALLPPSQSRSAGPGSWPRPQRSLHTCEGEEHEASGGATQEHP